MSVACTANAGNASNTDYKLRFKLVHYRHHHISFQKQLYSQQLTQSGSQKSMKSTELAAYY